MNALLRAAGLLLRPWTWIMAWRDSRRSRRRLLLYGASIVLGVAALTAIALAGRQMEDTVREQSRSLLGADLVVSTRDSRLTEQQEAFLNSLGGEQAREVQFASMVYFLKNDGTRLVQVRALEGDFPFYGELETAPADAVAKLRSGEGALVEGHLMELYEARVGDLIKVGDITLPIAGVLTRVPGETMSFGTLAPRVYVPLKKVLGTRLLQEGSLARYKVYFKLPARVDAEEFADARRSEFRALQLRYDSAEERQRELGQALDNMMRFLNLIGFVALLLGGVGVASGVHVHMKQKLGTIAILRCLGCSVGQSFAIYFAQAMALGLMGAVAGAALGVAVQFALPSVLADFLPFPLEAAVSWSGIWRGIWIGFLICLLFAILPLLPIRRISPLAAIRTAFSREASPARDPLVWLVYAVILGGLLVFGILQSREWRHGVGYALGIAGAFFLLALVAWVVSRVARWIVSARWPFVLRQGLSNLYRPNNRTLLLMVSLGMGTFLVLTLYLVQLNLLGELLRPKDEFEGNAVLFDIQTDQREGVLAVLQSNQLPVIDDVPMISMRLHSLKGRTVEEIRNDPHNRIRGWALGREYRSTSRPALSRTEKLVAGEWHPPARNPDDPIPISAEVGIAETLHLGIGDELVFDVQGVPVPARIASLREVDWRRLSPNFFFVFPPGSLEGAPAMHMVVTRVESSEQSARLQRDVVRLFPNVSAADLTLVLQTIESVLDKVSFVVRFMALFTVGTGLLVLGGTIVSGRYQRLQESILLRTLGATRRQVLQILTAEYLLLGVLAATTGIVFALGANWALAKFVFDVKPGFYPAPLMVAVGAVAALTLVFGLFGNRSILKRPPLEVLRAEG
ncbi:MAG TPA: FtsX-like permease family protein [Verrucomicrobia bacterium]|nr:FtsX-like permease family protein [Verrucomicrobiota bacterium]HOP97584.1 ABC transporter permease [Verrucomicrobiota bacterium]